MCLRPQWKHPNLTLKFHIVCFALSQGTNRYIKSEMKRLIVITLLGKLNEHIYWVNTTFRLLLKIPMVTLYIGVPCWNVASVFQWKKISHYKTVYNDLYFVVLVDTVGNLKDVTDIFVFLVGMQMKKKIIRENCNTVLNDIFEIIVQLITVERLKFSVLIFYPLNS